MVFLKRILDDIKRGENIDLYVTVTLAIIISILNAIGLANSALLSSISLAILALLASAILGNRHRLDDINEKLDKGNDKIISTEFPTNAADDFRRASEIWIVGVNANAALKYNYRTIIQEKLKAGDCKIKILLVDPDSPACEMAAARVPGKLSIERERANIFANLNDLCDLRKLNPDKIEVRVVNDPLMYGCYILDPDKIHGVIYYRRYSYQMGRKPKLLYRPAGNEWYDFIKAEVKMLWQMGKEWNCPT